MENQHKLIKGFRDLTQVEIDLMNRIKEFGPQLQTLISDLGSHLQNQEGVVDGVETEEGQLERTRLDQADPWRWLQTGRTDLQKGLMALTRAVAQPTFF